MLAQAVKKEDPVCYTQFPSQGEPILVKDLQKGLKQEYPDKKLNLTNRHGCQEVSLLSLFLQMPSKFNARVYNDVVVSYVDLLHISSSTFSHVKLTPM